jgi:hypothetical protein
LLTSSEYLTIRNMEPEAILNHYKQMGIECSNIAAKVHELNNEKEEHRLVVEQLEKLEDNRRAYRLIGGVLVEKTVNELLPIVQENLEGVRPTDLPHSLSLSLSLTHTHTLSVCVCVCVRICGSAQSKNNTYCYCTT